MLQQRQQETQTESRLQSYLDELQKPMTTLGEAERQEWRAEAQSHLESLIAAYEELGETNEEAVRSAMARFGQPQAIGFRMRWAAIRQVAKLNPENRVTNYIMRCFTWSSLPAALSFLSFILLYDYSNNPAACALARNAMMIFVVLGPLLSGWLLGRRLSWVRNEIRQVRAVHGPAGTLRLQFGFTAMAASISLHLAMSSSLVRIISSEMPQHFSAVDLIPALSWLPISLGVAYGVDRWRGQRTDDATLAGN